MIKAACLCRRIVFSTTVPLSHSRYCHCTNCQKQSGSAFAAFAMAQFNDLNFSAQGPVIEFNSGQGVRCHCQHCGSPVWFKSVDFPGTVMLPLGIIESGEVPAPQMHIFTRSKAPWCSLKDPLPQFDTVPESDS